MSEQLWPERLRRLSNSGMRGFTDRVRLRLDEVLQGFDQRRAAAGYLRRGHRLRLAGALAGLTAPFADGFARSRSALYSARALLARTVAGFRLPLPNAQLSPRARRTLAWVGAFAVLVAIEVALALPLLTGVSRDAVDSVQSASRSIVERATPGERRDPSALQTKTDSRAQPPAPRANGNGPGKRSAPAVALAEEEELGQEETLETVEAADASSSVAAETKELSPTGADSSEGKVENSRPEPRFSVRRGTPLAPAPKRPPAPKRGTPAPQPPPALPVETAQSASPSSSSTSIPASTRTTIRTTSPPPPPRPRSRSSTSTTTTTTTTTTSTTAKNPPPPPPPPRSSTSTTTTTTKNPPPPPPPPTAPPRSSTSTTTTSSTTTTTTSTSSSTSTSTTTTTCRGRRCGGGGGDGDRDGDGDD